MGWGRDREVGRVEEALVMVVIQDPQLVTGGKKRGEVGVWEG